MTIDHLRERCVCGAEFEIRRSSINQNEYDDSLRFYLQAWQREHALVCEKMAPIVRERDLREAQDNALAEDEREKRREKAKAYKERRLGLNITNESS